jgi:elongator complex protein 3
MENKVLKNLLIEASLEKNLTEKSFAKLKRKFMRQLSVTGLPSNMNLLPVYHDLVKSGKIKQTLLLEQIIKKRKIRTLSGIASITVLTKSWGCPGQCTYCPTEKGMPKSYLSNEPAVMRAILSDFDPYRQVEMRLDSLKKQGHSINKIEVIVIGGTWSAIPHKYQEWYLKRVYDALNGNKKGAKTLLLAQKKNAESFGGKKTKQKLVGLTLETRPDWLNEEEIKRMRKYGCTRVELGVQSIYNDVLCAIKRGHKIDATIKATKMLKDSGFKINYHMMPNLPKSTVSRDIKMLREIFSNSDFRPDLLKIYPCMVLKNTELYKDFKAKKFKPYTDKQLIKILKETKINVPEYCRIVRVIRDIPATSIVGGSHTSNLREYVKQEMKKEGKTCRCIRCREVMGDKYNLKNIKMIRRDYDASCGKEIFLSFEDAKNDKIVSLLRLRIPSEKKNKIFKVLSDASIIREVHTYGNVVPVSEKDTTYPLGEKSQQHKGLGKKLLKEAERITKKEFGLNKITVIAAVGVQDYYKKFGYKTRETYMYKKL